MIALLSPAKSLDFLPQTRDFKATEHPFQEETQVLVSKLRRFSKPKLKALMGISDKLVAENVKRYQDFSPVFTRENSKEAIFAFNGDVYRGLDAQSLTDSQIEYAQMHIRILSGLYGIMKPLDLMQAYRLEMGTKLPVRRSKNLYEFWDDKITNALNQDIIDHQHQFIINLASNEYFKSIKKKKLEAPIIDISFKEYRDGKLKHIQYNAKRARGLMARYMAVEGAESPEDLKGFDYEQYAFDENESVENHFLFVR